MTSGVPVTLTEAERDVLRRVADWARRENACRPAPCWVEWRDAVTAILARDAGSPATVAGPAVTPRRRAPRRSARRR